MKKNKYTFIDLFSGIGGIRLAFEKNGAECVFSSDNDRWANETYRNNFGEIPSGDLMVIKSEDIPQHNILCAGFPCQPFSLAGKRMGFEDIRGTLFFEVARILNDKKPDAFLLENVKGLTNHDNGNTISVIRATLDRLGYDFFEKLMNAKNYGLPQNRERWIGVGFRKSLKVKDFSFPKEEPLKITVEDILEKNVTDHKISDIAMKHLNYHYKNKFKSSSKKLSEYTIATEIRPSRCIFRNDGISPCLTAKMGTGGNNIPVIVELKRKLTVRECLRIQGFPDTFKINTSQHAYKQIGNSVPVVMMEKIVREIVKTLDYHKGLTTTVKSPLLRPDPVVTKKGITDTSLNLSLSNIQ